MKSLINGLYFSAIVLLLSGCSMEKRLYQKGYHIEWLSHQSGVKHVTEMPSDLDQTIKENAPLSYEEKVSENFTIASSVSPPVATAIANASNEERSHLLLPAPIAYQTRPSAQYASHVVQTSTEIRPENRKLSKQLFQKRNDDRLVLLIILALLLPPLAVYLFERNRWTSRCTLNLVLTLLCGLPGVIHALIVILGNR